MEYSITMIRYLMLILTTWVSIAANADCNKPIKIAVIDTGFGYQGRGINAKLCQEGHRDFSVDQLYASNFHTKDKVPLDMNGHGTNIVGIIEQYAKFQNVDYCIVVIKYYSTKHFDATNAKISYETENARASEEALKYLNSLRATIVNYSGGGEGWDGREFIPIRRYLNLGGMFVAAAGNNNQNLDTVGEYYPAMYDKRIIVVGSINDNGSRSSFSNYGNKVTRWENGTNVPGYGLLLSGTSQSTAVATGKIVGHLNDKCVR